MSSEKNNHPSSTQDALPIYRHQGRALGVSFQDVSVIGSVDSRNTALDLLEIFHRAVLAPLTIARRLVGNRRVPAKRILRDVSGVVFPGETMLVLGRPCSGCSTTLKVIGNSRESFANVQGEVRYATIGASDMAQRFSSEVVYCGEDDMHFPRLSVGHTTKFGLHLRRGGGGDASNDFVDNMADRLLHSLDIPHTKDTIVGDSFVRGVSGGERRRVSLLESLASNPAVGCWDNPIRGLDSSAALKFLRTLKKISQATGMANIVTLYQTSETMYTECFDRVMVLYEGRMIFCGKATEAKQYFVDLGFFCHSRQTTPEFLTAVASPAERVVRDDHHSPVSLDPDALAQTFRKSRHYEQLKADMEAYEFRFKSDPSPVNEFITEHSRLRSRWAIPRAPHPDSIVRQTLRATWRHFILLWNDRRSYFTAVLMTIITAVLNGSAFFHAPKTSTGSFMKGGGVFFTLIYFFLNALNQLSSTVTALPVLAKQHRLGFLHPVSYILAQTLADVPTAFLESMVFSAPYYFLLGLTPTASHFFTFYLIVSLFYCASLSLFRMLGAWSPNNNLAMLMGGAALPVSLAYSGYAPPVPTMLGWGSWIRRVSPSPWALEALMGNEFAGIDLRCTDSQMVPSGPGYGDQTYQGCPLPGAGKGRSIIPGEEYLEQYYGWYRANLWRNVGIIVAMWAIYVTLATIGLSVMIKTVGTEGGIVYKRGARRLDEVQTPYMGDKVPDVEKQAEEPASQTPSIGSVSSKHSPDGSECDKHESSDDDQPEAQRKATASTFTFEDVVYTINANGEEKRLLHNVSGYVKPGQLTALMGASGAGKTTLLDTLSQRKSEGRVEGTVLLNGKPLDAAFGRACGFCMQQDVHEPNATVREALQFSALMRQPKSVPDAEKLAHVEEIISLLELAPIADAIIGKPGIGGLGVEERKRVTIGVELAAKPSALLFLDEPTSGLDSQAAFSIVRFLQRIAAQGIPVVCTIHQPSGIIFDKFDHVLLLAPGGKTLYFGETGHNCRRVVDYFARYGAVMNETENPAEFIINTATSKEDPPKDWARIWTESPENQQVRAKISELKITAAAATEQDSPSAAPIQAFALPLQDQIIKLTTRHWISVWRDGFYNFSKLYKVLFTETFLAFNFFQADASLQGTQNRMLFFLLASWLVPTIVPDIQAVWYSKWALYTAREKNGIYSQHALVASLVLVELPWQALGSALAFLCSYWTIGYPPTATQTGYSLLLFCLLGVFGTGFAQTLAALCPSESVVAYANSLVWVVLTAFTGAAIPHTLMNAFYKPWLFWADPLRYFVGGAAENVMHGVSVVCAAHDLTVFDPPPGQTCGAYMTDYLAIGSGYLVDVDATSDCEYCSYADGDEYAASLDFWYGRRWRDFGIFLAFCVSNVVLAFLVPWVRRWWVRRK